MVRALTRVGFAAAFVSLGSCFAAPQVFWASDPVRPGEAVLVAGADFGARPTVEFAALPAGSPGRPGRRLDAFRFAARKLQPLQPANESLKFVVPKDAKPGAYVFRVIDRRGRASSLVRLNCPTVYWVQGDLGLRAASPGGWLRVFGRCVGSSSAAGAVALVNPKTGQVLSLRPRKASLWSVAVRLPADSPAGEWRVWVHNGRGAAFGWTAAGTARVAAKPRWPDRVFNVRDFGADGQGSLADAVAAQAAVAAAEKAGGGVVYFPRGRYRIESTLRVPRYVVLRGERMEWTALCWSDTNEPFTLVEGQDHFGLENLTLYASNYTHGIVGSIGKPDSGYVFLRRVRFRGDIYRGHLKIEQVDERFKRAMRFSTGGGDSIRLGGEGIEITDCDIYGSGRALFLFKPKGAYVARNTFYNGRWGWYCLSGCDGLILENNRIVGADLMSTGGGVNCLGGVAYSRNVYYAGNTLRLMHGWDREAMTSDAGYGAYYGRVASATRDAVVLPTPVKGVGRRSWVGAGVFILGGRGMGQFREVKSVSKDGKTVALDRPWAVTPDASSILTITMMQKNYLFIGNRFEDAGISLQYYGTSINHVAAGNACARAGGFYNSGRWYRHFQPSWYCQFLDNEILEGNGYRFGPNNATLAGDSFLGTFGLQCRGNTAPLAYCAVHRRNHLHNNALIRIVGVNREHPGVRDVVVENNVIENARVGLYVDEGCVGVLERGNVFKNVEQPRYDAAAARRRADARRAALLKQQGPAAYYSFDRVTGRLVPDDSGHGFLGVAQSSVRFVDGLSGKAARFDGSGYIVVADRGVLRFPRLTVMAWILPDDLKGRWGVVAKRTRNTTAPYVLAIRDGRVTFEATDAEGRWSYNLTSRPALRPDAWNCVAATCEEGKEVRAYCNGKLVGRKKVDKPLCAANLPLTIGFEAWGGQPPRPTQSGNFRGLIDEVRVWPRVLSPTEIAAEYEKLRAAVERDRQRRAAEKRAWEERLKHLGRALIHTEGVAWRPLIVEKFDQPKLSSNWVTLRGAWRVENGTLRCEGVSFLAYAKPVAAPVRIEYDARSKRPGDLTAFWGTKQAAYKGGYFIGFASNGNTANKILRLGQVVKTGTRPLAVPGKWSHVIAQVLRDRVQLIVDGRLALEYRDPHPARAADTAGLIAWSEAEFDNVVIYHGARL